MNQMLGNRQFDSMEGYKKESEEEIDELTKTVSEALEKSGVLAKIKANLRASIFDILQGEQNDFSQTGDRKKMEKLKGKEYKQVAQLFIEFLDHFGMKFTKSTFLKESGLEEVVEKNNVELSEELKLQGSNDREAVVFNIVRMLNTGGFNRSSGDSHAGGPRVKPLPKPINVKPKKKKKRRRKKTGKGKKKKSRTSGNSASLDASRNDPLIAKSTDSIDSAGSDTGSGPNFTMDDAPKIGFGRASQPKKEKKSDVAVPVVSKGLTRTKNFIGKEINPVYELQQDVDKSTDEVNSGLLDSKEQLHFDTPKEETKDEVVKKDVVDDNNMAGFDDDTNFDEEELGDFGAFDDGPGDAFDDDLNTNMDEIDTSDDTLLDHKYDAEVELK